ncbi:hypothetical protein LOCC1_G001347 [Lachnellula occidentalis]|uniref:Uncharacterized protein n=1 Tax=Lachnellula occidentalis TaxID=215460 RepID=A0A8H8S6Q2_9HELO|nr:hypothetical protein LOCC1_G001347 [Lachnellula occidentalis]
MVKDMCVDEQGRIRETMATKSFERIVGVRESTIEALFGICYEQTNYYTRREDVRCEFDSKICDPIIYGSLVLEYSEIGLWPTKSSENITWTITDLVSSIREVQVYTLGDQIHQGRLKRRSDCNTTSIRGEVSETFSRMQRVVLEEDHNHMDRLKPGRDGCLHCAED